MSETLYTEIPSLDLADFYGGDLDKKKKFVADLGAAQYMKLFDKFF